MSFAPELLVCQLMYVTALPENAPIPQPCGPTGSSIAVHVPIMAVPIDPMTPARLGKIRHPPKRTGTPVACDAAGYGACKRPLPRIDASHRP